MENSSLKEILLKNPSLLISGIIFIAAVNGIVYEFIFYLQFGINILLFSSFEDFIFSWTRDVNLILVYFFIVVIFYLVIKSFHSAQNAKYKSMPLLKIKRRMNIEFGFEMTFFLLYFINQLIFYKYYSFAFFISIMFFSSAFIISQRVHVFRAISNGKSIELSKKKISIYFIFALLFTIIWSSSNNASKIFNGDKEFYYSHTISNSDSSYNNYLLGRNSNFTFFYDKKENQTIIIPNKEVLNFIKYDSRITSKSTRTP